MANFTKEQTGMYVAIASILMLIAFFFVNFGGITPVKYFSHAGWFGIIALILVLLAPIYVCLYAFRDQKVLEPLKPILCISPGLAYSLPLIALGISLFALFFDTGWAVILYAIGAAAVMFVGEKSK